MGAVGFLCARRAGAEGQSIVPSVSLCLLFTPSSPPLGEALRRSTSTGKRRFMSKELSCASKPPGHPRSSAWGILYVSGRQRRPLPSDKTCFPSADRCPCSSRARIQAWADMSRAGGRGRGRGREVHDQPRRGLLARVTSRRPEYLNVVCARASRQVEYMPLDSSALPALVLEAIRASWPLYRTTST